MPIIDNPGKLADSGLGELRGGRVVRPPAESASQSNFNFRIGINFFKKPSDSRLHLQNMSVGKSNRIVGDGIDIVPSTFESDDVR